MEELLGFRRGFKLVLVFGHKKSQHKLAWCFGETPVIQRPGFLEVLAGRKL
jgi:hypothetical protein